MLLTDLWLTITVMTSMAAGFQFVISLSADGATKQFGQTMHRWTHFFFFIFYELLRCTFCYRAVYALRTARHNQQTTIIAASAAAPSSSGFISRSLKMSFWFRLLKFFFLYIFVIIAIIYFKCIFKQNSMILTPQLVFAYTLLQLSVLYRFQVFKYHDVVYIHFSTTVGKFTEVSALRICLRNYVGDRRCRWLNVYLCRM